MELTFGKPQICGLGMFAKDVAKAGYRNLNGTVNLLEAQYVMEKHGELIPKWQLDKETRQELKEASKAMREKILADRDSFQRDTVIH